MLRAPAPSRAPAAHLFFGASGFATRSPSLARRCALADPGSTTRPFMCALHWRSAEHLTRPMRDNWTSSTRHQSPSLARRLPSHRLRWLVHLQRCHLRSSFRRAPPALPAHLLTCSFRLGSIPRPPSSSLTAGSAGWRPRFARLHACFGSQRPRDFHLPHPADVVPIFHAQPRFDSPWAHAAALHVRAALSNRETFDAYIELARSPERDV